MFYAIDFNAEVLDIRSAPTAETLAKKGPPEGMERLIVGNFDEFIALEPDLLLRIANFKTKGGQLDSLPSVGEIWAMLEPAPRTKKPKAAKAKLASTQDLTPADDSLISEAPEGDVPPTNENKEANMAKTEKEKAAAAKAKAAAAKDKAKAKAAAAKEKEAAKKAAAKEKAAARKANGANGSGPTGAPREGTKAAKLLELVTRSGGATFAEMQKATGWKEMRGTALTLAARVGKTLSSVKDPDGKKATRWVAK
jgi:hypothetical protein